MSLQQQMTLTTDSGGSICTIPRKISHGSPRGMGKPTLGSSGTRSFLVPCFERPSVFCTAQEMVWWMIIRGGGMLVGDDGLEG